MIRHAASISVLLAMLGWQADAQDFMLEDEVALCVGCHGEDGRPVDAEIPIIWGQEFYYTYVQLRDYQAGRRANEVMQANIEDYSKDQLKQIAQYFADKTWPALQAEDGTPYEAAAQSAFVAGQCSACHGTFKGDSRVPRVAGQSAGYLYRTMRDFKEKVRLNAPDKGFLMRSYDDETLEAMAKYLASL